MIILSDPIHPPAATMTDIGYSFLAMAAFAHITASSSFVNATDLSRLGGQLSRMWKANALDVSRMLT
jgi:hypothetical protein